MLNMRDPYNEEYKKSPNQGGKIWPKFIILHHSAGNFAGTVSWILNSKSKVSYHYVINPADGNRVQLVYDTKRAWHAGKSSWGGRKALNGHSVGIAFDRDTNTRTPSGVEIDSCAHKCIYLMDKFGISACGILTHEQVSPGRKNDVSRETHKLVLDRVCQLQQSE